MDNKLDLTDTDTWTLNDLDKLMVAIREEQERRWIVENAKRQAEELSSIYQRAIGRHNGDPWMQPTGAHDAYRKGFEVSHKDKQWVSLIAANVWEPGVSGWREVVPENEDGTPAAPPEWVQPTGAHDAYQIGDLVTFQGKIYESLIGGNVWSPDTQGAFSIWREVVPENEVDPPVDEPVDPPTEEPVEPPVDEPVEPPVDEPVDEPVTPSKWVQPTGSHDAYQLGDLITFEGKVYKSRINGNVWSPTGSPAGWELVS